MCASNCASGQQTRNRQKNTRSCNLHSHHYLPHADSAGTANGLQCSGKSKAKYRNKCNDYSKTQHSPVSRNSNGGWNCQCAKQQSRGDTAKDQTSASPQHSEH